MKSRLGLLAALGVTAAFALAYFLAMRTGASWFDGQWLFVVALPYNWTMLRLSGESDFSPDAPAQIAAAILFEAALAYLAGAGLEAVLRRALRWLRRSKFPA